MRAHNGEFVSHTKTEKKKKNAFPKLFGGSSGLHALKKKEKKKEVGLDILLRSGIPGKTMSDL